MGLGSNSSGEKGFWFMAKNKYQNGNSFELFFNEVLGYNLLADEHQYEYAKALLAPVGECQAVFVDAKAGTGKTALALAAGYYAVETGRADRIVYVRNAVEVRQVGFLPGTIEEKEAAYMKPVYDVIQRIGYKRNIHNLFDDMLERGHLICTTTTHQRGVDYEGNTFMIIDEAQNLDLNELQMMLTRPHDSVKVVIIGSSLQNDDPKAKVYGPDNLLAFQLYQEHFRKEPSIRTAHLQLVRNYRGHFANYADQISETLRSIQ